MTSAKRALVRAQRLLRTILKRDSALPDLALFRKATTVGGHDELGEMRARQLIRDMKTIEARLRAIESQRWLEQFERLGGKADFTDEERRLILSTLHPDANASSERREAAFKAFNAKRGRQTQS